MLYVNPRGPVTEASQTIAAFLGSRGFTRIPMRLTGDGHYAIDGAINGHPAKLVVDTGASFTLIANSSAMAFKVTRRRRLGGASNGDGGFVVVSDGLVDELRAGSFVVPKADVSIAEAVKQIGDGLLGEEYLTFNFAVVDIGGMALYLRHPDR
jgi:hypothetical protein